MQENKKTIKLQKVGTIALLCLLVVAFVGSIFCAIILPFANLAPELQPPSHAFGAANGRRRLKRIVRRIDSFGEDDAPLVQNVSRHIVKNGPAERIRAQIKA